MKYFVHKTMLVVLVVFLNAGASVANEKENQAIADQKTKLETLKIVKDAIQLIEDVGFPEKNRLKVYLSHASGKYFGLQKITVLIDGLDKSEFVYNEKQRKALLRGGSNRVYLGSVSEGIHELVVVFEGADRKNNIIKKAETWLFDKKPGEYIVVLSVADDERALRPVFSYKIIKGSR